MKFPVNHFLSSFLCSFSQIMLQRSTVTGLLFVVGIGLNSLIMLLGATTAILSALVIAKLCKYDTDLVNSGLYGYNAALVGIAVFYFLPANSFSFTLVILAGAISTVIMHSILQLLPNFSAFTTPFIFSTWLLLLLMETLAIDTTAAAFAANASGDFYVVMRGVSQVMFQDYWLSGAVFIAGLALYSYQFAAWAVTGSVAGMIIARIFNFSDDLVLIGFYGFNASLTAIALATRYTKRYSKKNWPILLGIIMSVLFTKVFEQLPIPALTAPFVLASWIIIGLVRIDSYKVIEAP